MQGMECSTSVRNFWEEGAQTILFIPISKQEVPNKLTWGLSTNGSFIVKSAYSSTLSLKCCKEGEVLATIEHTWFWMNIWTLKISEKVKKIPSEVEHRINPIYFRNM